MSTPRPIDVLGGPEPAEPAPRDRRTPLVAALAGAAVAVGGAGVALAVALSGGGPQPEDALPASTVALAKVDLDPAGGQKLAAVRLAERFPDLGVDGDSDLRDDLLRRLLDGEDVAYDRDVRPWIGSRAAAAGVLVDGRVEAVLALQVDDRDAAERLLPDVLAGLDEPAAYAFSEAAPYVLLAGTQAVADGAAGAGDVLAEDPQFRADVDALDGDQVALAWADLGALWPALPEEQRGTLPGGLDPTGRVVTGVHLEDDAVEVTGRTFDVELGDGLAVSEGDGLVRELPAGAAAAVSLAGLGEQLGAVVQALDATSGPEGVAGLGVTTEELAALLGTETAVGVYEEDGLQVGVRTRSDDPAAATGVAQRLVEGLTAGSTVAGGPAFERCAEQYAQDVEAGTVDPGLLTLEAYCGPFAQPVPPSPPGEVRPVEDGVVFGSTPTLLERMAAGGGLGDDELFRRVVPDADGAGTVLYADVQALLRLTGVEDEDLAALEAVGAVGTADGFRLRLTVR